MIFHSNGLYSLDSNNVQYETNMKSNTSPSPYVASASSVYNTTYEPYKAFNGTTLDANDSWVTVNGTKTGWIQIDFGESKTVNHVYLVSRNNSDHLTSFPKTINVLGSNDGVSFTILKNASGITSTAQQSKTKIGIPISTFRYYRIEVLENNGHASYTAIGDIQFGFDGSDMYFLPNSNKDNFNKYGFGNGYIINLNKPIDRTCYVLQNTEPKNEEGLLIKKLDRKPLSIKFE